MIAVLSFFGNMKQGSQEKAEWFIVFTSSTLRHWLMRWLNPHFQHCYAMKKSAGGHLWVIIDPMSCYTKVTTEIVDDYPHPRLYAGANAVIVPVMAHLNPSKRLHNLCVFNCVEVVKSLLGIKDFWLWTPRQLYERLTNGR